MEMMLVMQSVNQGADFPLEAKAGKRTRHDGALVPPFEPVPGSRSRLQLSLSSLTPDSQSAAVSSVGDRCYSSSSLLIVMLFPKCRPSSRRWTDDSPRVTLFSCVFLLVIPSSSYADSNSGESQTSFYLVSTCDPASPSASLSPIKLVKHVRVTQIPL